jgi:hypothetical protein
MEAYDLISAYYGDKKAKRSGVRYMNHIDEGLLILDAIAATQVAKAAFCLHPILQDDGNLQRNLAMAVAAIDDALVIAIAMEYRNVANRYLCCRQIDSPAAIYLGPVPDVHDMLVADKVQNRKDFYAHHYGKHSKSRELDRYFRNWLTALGITESTYHRLASYIS